MPCFKSVMSEVIVEHCTATGIDIRSNEKKLSLARRACQLCSTSLVAHASVASIIAGKRAHSGSFSLECFLCSLKLTEEKVG